MIGKEKRRREEEKTGQEMIRGEDTEEVGGERRGAKETRRGGWRGEEMKTVGTLS